MLSAQLGLESDYHEDNAAVEQLDKIVARSFLETFTDGFITRFSQGLQIREDTTT